MHECSNYTLARFLKEKHLSLSIYVRSLSFVVNNLTNIWRGDNEKSFQMEAIYGLWLGSLVRGKAGCGSPTSIWRILVAIWLFSNLSAMADTKTHTYDTIVWSLMKKHMSKYTHANIHTCEYKHNWETYIRWMDCINANSLVVILYYSFIKCYHGGNWVESTWNLW